MTTTLSSQTLDPAPTAPAEHREYLFHPVIDFLCLGGLSLIILPWSWMQPETSAPLLGFVAIMIADFVNHPHFAHSYQIFYRGYGSKLRGEEISAGLRTRYVVAGIVVPIAMVVFFAITWRLQDARLMGYAGNVMAFLVGWHYTKQGYGMLMVDAAYKRRFFNDREKRFFLTNAYTSWIFYWVSANWLVKEYELWGLQYYAIPFPRWVLFGTGGVMAVTTVLVLVTFSRVHLAGRRLPWNGVLAYLVSIYVWTGARWDPMLLIFVPAFHSLQYLLVVWRFEANRATAMAAQSPARFSPRVRFLSFLGLGMVLGLLGFWWLPKLLDNQISVNDESFGGAVFLFMFWIFINLHHYFIDNVIWRRDNPETKQFLFG